MFDDITGIKVVVVDYMPDNTIAVGPKLFHELLKSDKLQTNLVEGLNYFKGKQEIKKA